MQEISPYQKLPRNPATTQCNGFRNANDAHRIRTLTKQTTHGDDVDETLRTTATAQWKTERGRRVERMRRKLPSAARTPSRPRFKLTTDAAVLLPDVAAVLADATGLRANRFEEGGRSEAATAGSELATEIPAN